MQTRFSKYFHHLSVFSRVPASFHLVGINVAKKQNLHPLGVCSWNQHPLLDLDTKVTKFTLGLLSSSVEAVGAKSL